MTGRPIAVPRRGAVRRGSRRLGTAVFGDRRGFALFLACLCFFGLYWRAGIFVTDTATLVETVDAVSGGRLWIDRATGDHFVAPGAYAADGYVYGRNYGQVVAALPFLWAVELLAWLADIRVALTALWHLCLLGVVVQVAHLRNADTRVRVAGSLVVLVSFVLNLVMARQFVDVSTNLVALQLVTLVAGGLVAVVTYRLVARDYGPRTGTLAGGAAAVVLPVGFWAPLPKRHVLTALVVVSILYSFHRSRTADDHVDVPWLGSVPGFRALTYALVGLLAWINGAEAVFVFLAVVVVDVPTAPTNDARTLAVVGATFAISLLPFALTNLAVSGNPFRPPETLTQAKTLLTGTVDPASGGEAVNGSVETSDGGSGGGGGSGDGTGSGEGSSGGSSVLDPLPVAFVAESGRWLWSTVLAQASESVGRLVEPEAFYRTYVRSGSLEILGTDLAAEFRAVNLSVLESVPLAAGLVAVLPAAVANVRSSVRDVRSAVRPTDLLAVALVLSFVLLYNQFLPNRAQVTVRYLLPTYPLVLYLLVRLHPVRSLVTERRGVVIWTYVGAVLLGTQVVLAYVVLQRLPVADAAQLHAVLGLGAAGLFAGAIFGQHVDRRIQPAAAVALGLSAAAGTAFILLSGLAYFSFAGEYVLPVSEVVSELIGPI